MANGITCSNNILTMDLGALVGGITGKVTATGCGGLRIVKVSAGSCTPITCYTHDKFIELFARSIVIASDGLLAIRVIDTEYESGDGLEVYQKCLSHIEQPEDLMRHMFVVDSEGNVALNLLNVS